MFSYTDEPKSCHVCESPPDRVTIYSCTNTPLCHNHYCLSCIKTHFSNLSSPEQFKLSSWLCYACQSKCQCSKCLRKKSTDLTLKISLPQFNDPKPTKSDKNFGNQKKPGSKKTIRFNFHDENQSKQRAVEIFDLDQESEEYVTPSFLKSIENPSKSSQPFRHFTNEQSTLFDAFKEESMTPIEYSSDINIGNQRKSKTIIKCKKQRNFVGLKVDRVPPYLESIMKRKELFRNFMEKHSKKSFEQLVKEENERIQEEKKREAQSSSTQRFERADIPSPVMKTVPINSHAIVDNLFSPARLPETPSFVPIHDPPTPVPNTVKLSELLHEQLKEMDDDDLSIELL